MLPGSLGLFSFFLLLFTGLLPWFTEAQHLTGKSFDVYTSPHAEPGGSFAEFVAETGDIDGDGTTKILVGASGETVEGRKKRWPGVSPEQRPRRSAARNDSPDE